MADIRDENKIDMHVRFEPLMPKIADKFPQHGKEMMVIDIDKVVMGGECI